MDREWWGDGVFIQLLLQPTFSRSRLSRKSVVRVGIVRRLHELRRAGIYRFTIYDHSVVAMRGRGDFVLMTGLLLSHGI